MHQYFIHDGLTERGPFTLDELKAKHLPSETPIWYQGLIEWTTLATVPELITKATAKLVPPPFNKVAKSEVLQTEEISKSYSSAMAEYFPVKKNKTFTVPLLVGLGAIILTIIFWLVTRNNQNSTALATLQEQVSREKDETKRFDDLLTEKNLNYRRNWDRYIIKEYTEPKIDYTLGGISAFNVYVSNKTDYTLDEVDLRIEYIRKSGEVWQARTLTFFNVTSKSVETLVAPTSVNGVKVRVEIQKIICKKMQFCYPNYNGSKDDPFYCR